jgi:7-cyano-7-deazaguanine synthase
MSESSNQGKKADLYVFWTSGFDSTFRMVQIQKEIVDKALVVQPIYVSGNGRKSEAIEIERMKKMIPMLREIGNNEILDLLIVEKDSIPANEEISAAYNRIASKIRLGTQYDWLARLALQYPGIEVGVQKPNGEYGGCNKAIATMGSMEHRDNCYYVNKEKSDPDFNLVFGNFSYPILDIKETRMVELIHEWKCEDIMDNIWFCFIPIDGKPCGYCRPCQQKMECDMEWLIPENGRKRYRLFKRAAKVVGTKNSYAVTGFLCRKIGYLK